MLAKRPLLGFLALGASEDNNRRTQATADEERNEQTGGNESMTNTIRAPEWPATRVRALCDRLNLSFRAIAEKIGCDTATLRQWRAGKQHPTARGYVVRLEQLEAERKE
jgi:DNA-binding transcriptional regulator YiaG